MALVGSFVYKTKINWVLNIPRWQSLNKTISWAHNQQLNWLFEETISSWVCAAFLRCSFVVVKALRIIFPHAAVRFYSSVMMFIFLMYIRSVQVILSDTPLGYLTWLMADSCRACSGSQSGRFRDRLLLPRRALVCDSWRHFN